MRVYLGEILAKLNRIGQDNSFNALYVQDPIHKILYQGKLFSAGFIVDSVSDGGKMSILMNARSADTTVFMGWGFTGNGHVHAFEVSSWTGGSALNLANNFTKYHGVNSVSGLLITDPTSINVQANSDSIWGQLVPGGIKQNAVGARAGPGEHQIIGAGKTMLVELTNHSGGGASLGFDVVCHEEPIVASDQEG